MKQNKNNILFSMALYSAKEICAKSDKQAKITEEREKQRKLSKNVAKLSNKIWSNIWYEFVSLLSIFIQFIMSNVICYE